MAHGGVISYAKLSGVLFNILRYAYALAVVTLYTFPYFIKLINARNIDNSATPIPPIHSLGAPG